MRPSLMTWTWNQAAQGHMVRLAGVTDGNSAMNRRVRGVLLVGSLVAVTVVVLATALVRNFDHDHCKTGFPTLIKCTYTW